MPQLKHYAISASYWIEITIFKRKGRTLDLLRDQFYWPGMTEDATRHIQHCERCLQLKASPDRAPMENVDATYPMELVHMDYLTIKATEGGKDIDILVIIDHFTRYAQAIVTSLQSSREDPNRSRA